VPRPNLPGLETDDWDESVADLQYRDAFEFAVDHNVATRAVLDAEGQCREVHTCWIPGAEVEYVAPASLGGVELAMEKLAALVDGGAAQAQLTGLVKQALDWIAAQQPRAPTAPKNRKDMAQALLNRAQVASDRIANRVMATAARRRFAIIERKEPSA